MAKDYLLFGRNTFREALRLKIKILEIFHDNDGAKKFIEAEVRDYKLNLRSRAGLPKEALDAAHQGVAFRIEHSFYLKNWEIEKERFPLIVLCNHLEDIQNLGAICRSASAFSVSLIVHEDRRSVRLNSAAIKVSAGQALDLKFYEVGNLAPFCRNLKDSGYTIAGLETDQQSLYSWAPKFPLALVVGSESQGLSKPVKNEIDDFISIPMKDGVESLNAATATSIALSWIQHNGHFV